MTSAGLRPTPVYMPYQQAFISRFAAEARSGAMVVLRAPAGTGKLHAIVGAVSQLVDERRAERTLILTPTALAWESAHRFEERGLDAFVVDGKALRLLRDQLGPRESDWPAGVYCMSLDLGRRSDTLPFVTGVSWDVVVVDEAHTAVGQRAELVRALIEKAEPPALLMATATPGGGLPTFSERATVIDWTELPEVRSLAFKGDVHAEIRPYRSSSEEAEAFGHVRDMARRMDPPQAMLLLRRASSSINSLEETLTRRVDGAGEPPDDGSELETLLAQIEELHVDSRLAAFQELLEELIQGGKRHVVALCEPRATLEYVAAAVERPDFPDYRLHGAIAGEARQDIVSRFEFGGGLLITTDAASEGVSLSFVDAVIHYDLPLSSEALARREGRYLRYGRSQPCTVYFLEDEAGAVPLYGQLMRKMLEWRSAAGVADIDIEALIRAEVGRGGGQDAGGRV